ncbi:MAG: BCD family MFS transporter [Halieaceae bacterium]|jgi:BCD family chlorophyll transporter-like MFS transporter
MSRSVSNAGTRLAGFGHRWLPFADAASADLSLPRLLRLSLFQLSTGMAVVLLTGTLNRVMVVELGQAAVWVSLMLAIPLLLAPARALIGYRSDHHRSYLGWRRIPYLWSGTMMQFGGLAFMPFALILMTEAHSGPEWMGPVAAMGAFLLTGLGMHVAQTAGLALATDLATEETRPRVVALLYFMLLVGMIGSALIFAAFLENFSYFRLIQVIQSAAVVTLVLNVAAMLKQEMRRPDLTDHSRVRPTFGHAWQDFIALPRARRLLWALGLGTMGFTMQDILLEPYGAQVLGLSVSDTTLLTAMFAGGMILALLLTSRRLGNGADPIRTASMGILIGIVAFAAVILSAPFQAPALFQLGAALIGLGNGLFAVGMLTAAMVFGGDKMAGLTLGAWGAVQAAAAGVAMFSGGAIRDLVAGWADAGLLGIALQTPASGYGAVYHIEIALLFVALAAMGRLVRRPGEAGEHGKRLGLADFPS